jgi:2-methylcitrate dehydratase PrpD
MPEDKRTSPVNAGIFADVPAFVRGLTFADLPADVVAQARRCLLDLIGVAAAGSQTDAAQIVNNYAATQLCSSETEARMLFGGRRASPAGAAFAGATTIDSFDAHDGHDLGSRWRIREQYFKAYPVCRWAQPAIEAALTLQSAANFSADDIEEIAIETFAEAAALGAGCAIPNATDEAQYSLPHPVAAALVFGQVGAEEIALPRLADPRIRRLLAAMKMIEDAEFSRRFLLIHDLMQAPS